MGNLFSLLPLLFKASDLIPRIQEALKSGANIFSVLKQFAPELIALFESLGGGLFPELPKEVQAEAGATMFDRENVKWIQAEMNKRGHATPPLVVDGYYGQLTKEAVKNFQRKYDQLEVDGWAGPATTAVLKSL